jgi:hypothetical protein
MSFFAGTASSKPSLTRLDWLRGVYAAHRLASGPAEPPFKQLSIANKIWTCK